MGPGEEARLVWAQEGLQPWVQALALLPCGTPDLNGGLRAGLVVMQSVACSHTHPILGDPSGLGRERSGPTKPTTFPLGSEVMF